MAFHIPNVWYFTPNHQKTATKKDVQRLHSNLNTIGFVPMMALDVVMG